MLALLLTLSGCGQDGKVSNRKFEKYLNLYLEYYEEEIEDEYDYCMADIFFDAVGNPIMFAGYANEDDEQEVYKLFGVSGKEVEEIKSFKKIDYLQFFTDGFVKVYTDSDNKTEIEWLQINNNEYNKVAEYYYYDDYQGTKEEKVTFILEDERIKIDLVKDREEGKKSTDYEDVYKKVCKEFYPNKKTAPADKYVQTMWLDNININREGFLHSPSLTYDEGSMYVDFDEKIDELLEAGSMSAEEYLVWQCNYVNENELYEENGWHRDIPWLGVHFLYRDIELLNEIEIDFDYFEEDYVYEKNDFLRHVVSYIEKTDGESILKNLQFIDSVDEDDWVGLMSSRVTSHIIEYYKELYSISDSSLLVEDKEYNYVREEILGVFDEEIEGKDNVEYYINTSKFLKTLPNRIEEFRKEFEEKEKAEKAERAERALKYYKEAYAEFLYAKSDDLKFELVKLNEDDVPELLIFRGTSNADRVDIYTYYDDGVYGLGSFGSNGIIGYMPSENIVGDTSEYGKSFYKIGEISAEKIYEFYSDFVTNTYAVNGVEVSKEDYDKAYFAWYDEHPGEWKNKTWNEAIEMTKENINKALGYDSPQQQAENTNTTDIDVEAEVTQIRGWYNDTQSRLEEMTASSLGDGDCYYDGEYLAKVIMHEGNDDWSLTYELYYHDQKLYFAFVYGTGSEYRAYFKDGQCIRMIGGDHVVESMYDLTNNMSGILDSVMEKDASLQNMIN